MIPPEEQIPFPPQIPSKTKSIKIKIEFSDDSGTKYSFNVEGSSKENITKIIDLAQSISTKETKTENQEPVPMDTNFAKLYGLLQARFRFGSFSSSDVLEAYQDDFQIPTTLSVISTYLSRMAHRGLLTRNRNGSGWIYKLGKNQLEPTKNSILQEQSLAFGNDITP